MSAADPYAEIVRHQYLSDPGAGVSLRGTCLCANRMSYNSAGFTQHVLEVMKPLMEAREREVIASTASELLDVIVKAGVVLMAPTSPYAAFGRSVLTFADAAETRYGCDSTGYSTVGHELVCDHRGCRSSVHAASITLSRMDAADAGWDVGIGDAKRLRVVDLCPEHRS